jgi:cytochrome c-type biogenesis protein CcmH
LKASPQILPPAGGKGFGRVLATLAGVLCLAAASDPAERLPDPAQEARAREIFQEVRCVVCQNESIDDSEAELAADLRRLVREQVAAGRTETQVRNHLVQRYGQFVLLKPSDDAANLPLWLAPFALVLVGGGGLYALWRRRRPEEPLSEEERSRLARLSEPET